MLPSSYDTILVIASIVVAIIASYTSLCMAVRLSGATGKAKFYWLIGGASAMGFGIWSMHFIGMLAFQLPIPLGYDITITVASLVLAICASWIALHIVSESQLKWSRLSIGGTLMGIGIATMHYSGMAAMRIVPGIDYNPILVIASILIAISASISALWIAFRLRNDLSHPTLCRIGASLIMGGAIVGMHYTGMAAANFPLNSYCGAAVTGIDTKWLAAVVSIVSLAVFAIAIIVSLLDARSAKLSTSLDKANAELVRLALHDSLTQLPNRVLLNDRLEQAVHRAERNGNQFVLFFMDLDGFKAVNDTHGHYMGDLLLTEAAKRLASLTREQDTLARLGGDEFILLVEPSTPENAALLAERIIASISEPFEIRNHSIQIAVSIGIAVYPNGGHNAHDLLVHADSAMYHAKSEGRGSYFYFEESMRSKAHRQLEMQQSLRAAVARNELVLHYQPQFDLATNQLKGFEALVRWQSETFGWMMPDDFLPLAESSGSIVPIGNWVIEEACKQLSKWRKENFPECTMSINISAQQLNHRSLFRVITTALNKYELPPASLTIEVTETSAMINPEKSIRVLQELSDLGVKISIDDFGSGYSSLLYVKKLPATELKIDKSFMQDLSPGSEDESIVRSIIKLGSTLGIQIIAEGVETDTQHNAVSELGCNAIQGFLSGRPTAPEDFDWRQLKNLDD